MWSFIRKVAVLTSLLVVAACGAGTKNPIPIRHPVDAGHRETRGYSTDATGCTPVQDGGGVECGGTADEVHNCIINAPTKLGIPVTVPKPVINYETCTP